MCIGSYVIATYVQNGNKLLDRRVHQKQNDQLIHSRELVGRDRFNVTSRTHVVNVFVFKNTK